MRFRRRRTTDRPSHCVENRPFPTGDTDEDLRRVIARLSFDLETMLIDRTEIQRIHDRLVTIATYRTGER